MSEETKKKERAKLITIRSRQPDAPTRERLKKNLTYHVIHENEGQAEKIQQHALL